MQDSIALIFHHAFYAGVAALLFMAGVLAAGPVLERRIKVLLKMPAASARWLRRLFEKRLSWLSLAAFIFCFNSTAIFVYMLTGIIPGIPYVMVFMIGLNVTLAVALAQKDPMPAPARPPNRIERACGILTFILELPCLWFAMGMAMTMHFTLADGHLALDWNAVRARLIAYVTVIVPTLAISALVEAYAVSSPYRRSKK